MGKKKNLTICHVNARSILANTRLFELEILCVTNKIDVCVSVKLGSHQVKLLYYCLDSNPLSATIALRVVEGLQSLFVMVILPPP